MHAWFEPFNSTPMAFNSISSGSPHVRPMGRTCGEPDEIKKNTHPKKFTALFREQVGMHAWFEQFEQQGDEVMRYFLEPVVLVVNYAKSAS